MRIRVQLPEYPCHNIVTGIGTGRGADGKRLLLVEATIVQGKLEAPCRDLVTLMYLHDAIASRSSGLTCNEPELYGSKANQQLAAERIAGAVMAYESI